MERQFLFPDDTMVVSFSRTPIAARPLRSAATAQGDTTETTQVLYVNGISTPSLSADFTSGEIHRIVDTIFASNRVATRSFYNRTLAEQPPPESVRKRECVTWFSTGMRGSISRPFNAMPAYMSACMRDSSWRRLSDHDLVESVRQVYSILVNTDAAEVDAIRLGHDVQKYWKDGRHVILVPHSQGTLMANQALTWLKPSYRKMNDSTCIGAVPLASPAKKRWELKANNIKQVLVDGDLVPALGFNTSPRTSTALSRRHLTRGRQIANVLPTLGGLYLTFHGYTTLHSVDNSYLRERESSWEIEDGIKQVYGACVVHSIEASQGDMTVMEGARFAMGVTFKNKFGEPLQRRMPSNGWTSSDSSIVRPTGDGGMTALSVGEATISAVRNGDTVKTNVRVIPIVPPRIIGTWVGNYTSDTDPLGRGTMRLIISGNQLAATATATWTDESGNAFNGSSSGSFPITGPNLDAATFFLVYLVPGKFVYASRFTSVSTSANSDELQGIASDGSGINTWGLRLTRVP